MKNDNSNTSLKRGRPPKKDYDPEALMQELINTAAEIYREKGEIKATALELDLPPGKVKKLLITGNVLSYPETKQIQALMQQGKNMAEIQHIMDLSYSALHTYLPYSKVIYKMLILTITNNILNARIVDKKFPQLRCKGKITSEDKKEIKKQVSGLIVSKICFMTRNSFDSIFVSAFISLTMTTVYNNYYYIVNAIVGVMNVITSAMIGGIGNSIAAESKKKNYNDFTVFNFIYMWISSWATVTLFSLYQNFMVLWVGEELTLPLLAPVLFSIYFYALKMCDIRTTYTSAAGLWWENRSRAICEIVANIILNYLLVQLWGVYGIVLATIIPLVLINFGFGAQVLFKHYFTEEKISGYFIDNVSYAVVTLISAMITFKINTFIGEYSVLNLVIRGIICCIIPNIIFLAAYCKSLKFRMAKDWVLTKIKRK